MQFDQLRRREFITLLGGAAATWPLRAQAQQPSMPVIGYLSTRSLGDSALIVAAFRKGLHEVGYTEGRNVAIEFRFAEGHHDRLQALTTDLVRRQVNVFVATGGTASAVAAKPIVPATIPMVFAMGGDPVKLGIVDGLARPGGNVTGISFLVSEMAAKHVQLLNELAPKTAVIGFLANPNNPNLASAATEAQKAADMLSLKLVVVNASAERDFDPAFTTLVQQRVDSLFVEVDPFFTDQRARIAALAVRIAGFRRLKRSAVRESPKTNLPVARRRDPGASRLPLGATPIACPPFRAIALRKYQSHSVPGLARLMDCRASV